MLNGFEVVGSDNHSEQLMTHRMHTDVYRCQKQWRNTLITLRAHFAFTGVEAIRNYRRPTRGWPTARASG
eukprot:678489-Pelagomonas_calceolata.AAC.1